MGARYVPCMRAQHGVQDSNATITWPCPNATSSAAECSLGQLCGFGGVPEPVLQGSLDAPNVPDQWWRFITPIFLHAGIVHIGFNMLLQVLLGGDMERIIGHVRFFFVYFASGIFGFVCGGVFAPAGIASTGASGALFGIIAIMLLDLLYTWPSRVRREGKMGPIKDLAFIIADVLVSFVLGLLPGVDNFSHIGGFVMGLLLGTFLLRSPKAVRRRSGAVRLSTGDQATPNGGAISVRDPGAETATATANGGAAELEAGLNGQTKDGASKRPQSTISVTRIPTNKFSPLPPLPLPDRFAPPPTSDPTPTTESAPDPEPPNLDNAVHTPPTAFAFKIPRFPRSPRHILFWILRAICLVMSIVFFVLLIKSFYTHHTTECHWCRYLSCLPVNGWCEIGDLVFVNN